MRQSWPKWKRNKVSLDYLKPLTTFPPECLRAENCLGFLIVFIKFYLITRTMSPPSGKVQSLHRTLCPNRWIASESELRLPEFMWVPLLWHITFSSDPPVRFTCLVELSAQTLTCSSCCSGRWPRQGATWNGEWRGKDLVELALSEGWSPFLCILPPPHPPIQGCGFSVWRCTACHD